MMYKSVHRLKRVGLAKIAGSDGRDPERIARLERWERAVTRIAARSPIRKLKL